MTFQALDLDLEGHPNSYINFSIVSGDPLQNFTISTDFALSQGEILLFPGTTLDYEAMPLDSYGRFNLVVMTEDNGDPTLNSTTSVYIYVEDMNDNSPYFNASRYFSSIPENSTRGMYHLTALIKP